MNTTTRARTRTPSSPKGLRSGLALGVGTLLVAGSVFGGVLPAMAQEAPHTDAMLKGYARVSASTSIDASASSATLVSSESVRVSDAHIVRVQLNDVDGEPVSGAADRLHIETSAKMVDVTSSAFVEVGIGVYESRLTSDHAGQAILFVVVDTDDVENTLLPGGVIRPVWHADVDLSSSMVEGVGDFAPYQATHTAIVRLRDKNDVHASGLADRIQLVAFDDVKGSLTLGDFTEEYLDGEWVYMAPVWSADAGQFSLGATYTEDGEAHELYGSPFWFWWHEEVDVLKSHAETIGWTQPLGTDHTVIVRLRDGGDQPVSGLADRLSIEAVDDATGLSWGSFTEDIVDGELVYRAPLSSREVGQSIITVVYDDGSGPRNVYGTPIPVWWSAAPTVEEKPGGGDSGAAAGEGADGSETGDASEGATTALPLTDALAQSGLDGALWPVGLAAVGLSAVGAFLVVARRRRTADEEA